MCKRYYGILTLNLTFLLKKIIPKIKIMIKNSVLFLIFILSFNLLISQELSFCNKDLNGNTTKITLNENGKGELNILRNGNSFRRGKILWSITTNNFPNSEIVKITLSTGNILRFKAIKYNQRRPISMLIDISIY